jgi:hypothetical protein
MVLRAKTHAIRITWHIREKRRTGKRPETDRTASINGNPEPIRWKSHCFSDVSFTPKPMPCQTLSETFSDLFQTLACRLGCHEMYRRVYSCRQKQGFFSVPKNGGYELARELSKDVPFDGAGFLGSVSEKSTGIHGLIQKKERPVLFLGRIACALFQTVVE